MAVQMELKSHCNNYSFNDDCSNTMIKHAARFPDILVMTKLYQVK